MKKRFIPIIFLMALILTLTPFINTDGGGDAYAAASTTSTSAWKLRDVNDATLKAEIAEVLKGTGHSTIPTYTQRLQQVWDRIPSF